MQFSELICKSYIDMDHLGTNLDQFLWVPSISLIAEISLQYTTLGVPDMQFSELICISY